MNILEKSIERGNLKNYITIVAAYVLYCSNLAELSVSPRSKKSSGSSKGKKMQT